MSNSARLTLQSETKKTSLFPQFCPVHGEMAKISSGGLDGGRRRSHLAAAAAASGEKFAGASLTRNVPRLISAPLALLHGEC